MKKIAAVLIALAVIAAAIAFFLSASDPLTAAGLPAHEPDIKNGERLYNAGGCHSCHKPSEKDTQADKALPSGGFALHTPIGTFYPPNLTPDKETGLGDWTTLQFVNALKRGIAPDGQHYLPAFPFTSYGRMKIGDIIDIKAYLDTMKPVSSSQPEPGVPLLWFVRRAIGLWKIMGFSDETFVADASKPESWNAGAYLVTGPGHCGECHTPRNIFMVSKADQWLAGGPHPEGKGKVPSLRSLIERRKDYSSAEDIKSALQWGETFGFTKLSSGGMASVQINMSKLPDSDVAAIAEYLASLK